MALVLQQQPEARLAPLRKRIDKIIKDKHEEVRREAERGGGGVREIVLSPPLIPAPAPFPPRLR